MTTSTTRVRTHVRTSKNGKTHKVRAHQRQVTLKDFLKDLWGTSSSRSTAAKSAGVVGLGFLVYLMSTFMSLAGATVWGLVAGCLGVLTYLFMSKPQRRAKRRKFRQSTALRLERRLKLWTHHKKVSFKRASAHIRERAQR